MKLLPCINRCEIELSYCFKTGAFVVVVIVVVVVVVWWCFLWKKEKK